MRSLLQRRKLLLENTRSLSFSLPMSAIMMWFSGSSIQIFSVMMTGTLFWTPIKALLSFPSGVFGNLDTPATHSRLAMPKLVFVLCQLLSIVLGVIKLQWMGYTPVGKQTFLIVIDCCLQQGVIGLLGKCMTR